MSSMWQSRIWGATLMLLAIVALTGCETVYQRTQPYLGSPQYAAVDPATVQILPAEPKQPHVALGEVIVSTDGNPSRQKLEDSMRAGAAKMGANAVFIASDRTHVYPIAYWGYWGYSADEDWRRTIVGVAIKYK